MDRVAWLALAAASFLSACTCTEIRVVDDDDGGGFGAGGAPVTSGGGEGAGASGSGGSGGSGGGGSDEGVPGCEVLQRHGPLLLVPNSYGGSLLPSVDGEMGVVFRTSNDGPTLWDTNSSRILEAFDGWPPALGPQTFHYDYHVYNDAAGHGRADGTYATTGFYGWFVASFLQKGVLAYAPTRNAQAILQPYPGEGVYWAGNGELAYYAAVDDAEPSAVMPLSDSILAIHGTNGEGELVLLGSELRVVRDGQLISFGGPAPEGLSYWPKIVPREGGVWVGGGDIFELLTVDESGWSAPFRPLGDQQFWDRWDMAAWRGGVALVTSGQPESGFTVAVTDGDRVTRLKVPNDEALSFCHNGVHVVPSPDGASIYVGYLRCAPDANDYAVARFDCASPFR